MIANFVESGEKDKHLGKAICDTESIDEVGVVEVGFWNGSRTVFNEANRFEEVVE